MAKKKTVAKSTAKQSKPRKTTPEAFEHKGTLAKVQNVLRKANILQSDMHLKGFLFTPLALAASYTCDQRVEQTIQDPGGGTHSVWVCVKWSDGQNHSNDPDVPDTP